MAMTCMSEYRLSCYNPHMLCAQEYPEAAETPYQLWLARNVERAVEKVLQYEEQVLKVLEDYADSRKWALPQVCEQRRLVISKIHSLLLQWRPDFSVQWGLRIRRSLPILETTFSHMTCCIEDYSHPLLIEPRLKRVLCLLDQSLPWHNKSAQPPSSILHGLSMLFYNLQDPSCCRCSSEHTYQTASKDCICKTHLLVDDGEEAECPHPGSDRRLSRMTVHEACNVTSASLHADDLMESENMAEGEQKTNPACILSSSCVPFEDDLQQRLDPRIEKTGPCRSSTDELGMDNLDDMFEWSKLNLHSRGTVADLMASELRSSRKEEANQALLNALASQNFQILEDTWKKHGEFASKWIMKKIKELLKRSKSKERDLGIKRVVQKHVHASVEEKCSNAWVPFRFKRNTSKGLLGLLRISCHMRSPELGIMCSSSVFEASDVTSCCLIRMCSKHAARSLDEKDIDVIQADSLMSFPVSSSVSDHDRDAESDIRVAHANHDCVHPYCTMTKEHASSSSSTCSKGASRIGSTYGFSHDTDKPGVALMCHRDDEAKTSVGDGCVDVKAESSHADSSFVNGRDLGEASKVGCTAPDSDVRSAGEDQGSNQYAHSHLVHRPMESCSSDLSNCDMHAGKHLLRTSERGLLACRSTIIDHLEDIRENTCIHRPSDNFTLVLEEAGRSLIQRREDQILSVPEEHNLSCSGEYKGSNFSSPHIRDEDPHGQPSTVIANMPAGLIDRDRGRQEERESPMHVGNSSPEGNECTRHEGAVAMADHAHIGLAVQQSRDEEERQGSGRRRARVPLSSLLAERDDLGERDTAMGERSFSVISCSAAYRAEGTSKSPWDAWEEPSEALDPLCCVCMIGLRGAAFTPCGHTFCRKCSRELWKGRGTCPLCNKLITGILDIF